MSLAEPGMAELGLMSSPSPAVETCPSVGAAGQETLRLLEASPASRPSSPTDPPEPRVTTEHTNNRIGELASGGDPGEVRAKGAGWGWVLGPPTGTRDPGPAGSLPCLSLGPHEPEVLLVKAVSHTRCVAQLTPPPYLV